MSLTLFQVLVPLVSALIGGGLTLLGQGLAQRRQWRQDMLKDKRARRDARLERLRAAYATIVRGATLRGRAAGELHLYGQKKGQTVQRQADIEESLLAAQIGATLEVDTVDLLELEGQMRVAMYDHDAACARLAELHRQAPNDPLPQDLIDAWSDSYARIGQLNDKIRETARRHLETIERSVDRE